MSSRGHGELNVCERMRVCLSVSCACESLSFVCVCVCHVGDILSSVCVCHGWGPGVVSSVVCLAGCKHSLDSCMLGDRSFQTWCPRPHCDIMTGVVPSSWACSAVRMTRQRLFGSEAGS